MPFGKKVNKIKVWNPETRRYMWVVPNKEYLEAKNKREAEALKNGPELFEGLEERPTTDGEVYWNHAQYSAGKEKE